MLTYLLAVTCFSVPLQDSIDDHTKRYNNLREMISSVPDETKLRVIVSESEALLNGPLMKLHFGGHIKKYLDLAKKDAQFLIALRPSEKEAFFKNLDKVRKMQDKNVFDIKLYNEREMSEIVSGLKKSSIDGSLIVYRISSLKESFDIISDNGKTKLADLDVSFEARKKALGNSSPELCHNLQVRVLYYYQNSGEEKLKETVLEIDGLMPDDYPGAFGDKLYGKYFFLKYLVESENRINDAYAFYKTMDYKKNFVTLKGWRQRWMSPCAALAFKFALRCFLF